MCRLVGRAEVEGLAVREGGRVWGEACKEGRVGQREVVRAWGGAEEWSAVQK